MVTYYIYQLNYGLEIKVEVEKFDKKDSKVYIPVRTSGATNISDTA